MGGATQGGTAEPTSRDQNTRQDRGQGNGDKRKSHKWEEIIGAQTEASRQSGASYDKARRGIEHVRADGRSQFVATHNVRTMAMDETHGVGRTLDVLSVCDRLGCDVIGLQETCRSGHSTVTQAGYLVYYSGECGGENREKKGQGGVGLAVRTSIRHAVLPPEFISDRLLEVTLQLRGRANGVAFFVAYAPTGTHNASNKHVFWTTLDRAVEEVPRH